MPEPDEAALEAPAFDHIWTSKVPVLALPTCLPVLDRCQLTVKNFYIFWSTSLDTPK